MKNPLLCQHAVKAAQAARVLPKPESTHKRQTVICTSTSTNFWRASQNSPKAFLVQGPIEFFTIPPHTSILLPNPFLLRTDPRQFHQASFPSPLPVCSFAQTRPPLSFCMPVPTQRTKLLVASIEFPQVLWLALFCGLQLASLLS